jgi:hypothetical protein
MQLAVQFGLTNTGLRLNYTFYSSLKQDGVSSLYLNVIYCSVYKFFSIRPHPTAYTLSSMKIKYFISKFFIYVF